MPDTPPPETPGQREQGEQDTGRWIALICQKCGGISDGPVEDKGTCQCPRDEVCKPVPVIALSDTNHLRARAESAENTVARVREWAEGGHPTTGKEAIGPHALDKLLSLLNTEESK